MRSRADRLRLQGAAVLLAGFAAGLLLASALSNSRSAVSSGQRSTVVASSGVPSGHVLRASDRPPSFLAPRTYTSFQQLARQLKGEGTLEIALEPELGGAPTVLGADTPAPAGSTIAIPLFASLLRALEIERLSVSAAEKSDAATAIDEPEGAPVAPLFVELSRATGGVDQALRLFASMLGIETTVTWATNGPTDSELQQIPWSPSESSAFFGLLTRGCLLSVADEKLVITLMNEVSVTGRWGAGSAGFAHPVTLVDGWGHTSSGYFVRQDALVNVGGTVVAVSMIARRITGNGWLGTGESMLSSAALWLHRELVPVAMAPLSCPSTKGSIPGR